MSADMREVDAARQMRIAREEQDIGMSDVDARSETTAVVAGPGVETETSGAQSAGAKVQTTHAELRLPSKR